MILAVSMVLAAPANDETIVGQLGPSDTISPQDDNQILLKLKILKKLLFLG